MNPYIIGGLIGIGFTVGWQVKDWHGDSIELAAEKAAQVVIEVERNYESKVAKKVEERLRELRANERIIEKQIPKIIERPVYNIECIDSDGLDIINGRLPTSSATGESSGEMPR